MFKYFQSKKRRSNKVKVMPQRPVRREETRYIYYQDLPYRNPNSSYSERGSLDLDISAMKDLRVIPNGRLSIALRYTYVEPLAEFEERMRQYRCDLLKWQQWYEKNKDRIAQEAFCE